MGQAHLLGPGKPLRLAFESGKLHSMILWGRPASARPRWRDSWQPPSMPNSFPLSAVFSGRQGDSRGHPARGDCACQGRHTILFVDEVHRFNKSQQDAFLPFVEQGLVTFVGATTENPP